MATNRKVDFAPFESYPLFYGYPIATIRSTLDDLLQYVPEGSVHELMIEASGDLIIMAGIQLDLLKPDEFKFLNNKGDSLYKATSNFTDVFEKYCKISRLIDSTLRTLKGIPIDQEEREQQEQDLIRKIDLEKPWLLFQGYEYSEYWFSSLQSTNRLLQSYLPENSTHRVVLQTGIELAGIANINPTSVPAVKMELIVRRITQLDDVVDDIGDMFKFRATATKTTFKARDEFLNTETEISF